MNEYEIFCSALDLKDPTQRKKYLDEACGPDHGLRQRVEALLAAHADPHSFLEREAVAGIRQELNAALMTDAMELSESQEAEASSPPLESTSLNLNADVLKLLQPSQQSGSLGRLGHYEVQAVIGRGGCGIVLRGYDAKLHRTVAVKMIAPELAATSPARQRFLREARAAAAVTHQNVVHIYSVEAEPFPYLVMEYVSGDSLQQRLDESGPFTVEEISHWGLQIAQGLAASHAQGVVHRDMKPANILLDSMTNQVKITDFGLARTADDACLTRSGVIAGTPLYMSPEQAQGLTVDHRTDLFSLGSVLYALCSGRPPFRAGSTMAILRRVVEDEPRPLQELIPELPSWLIALIGRLHAKDPNARFPSATEVVRTWEAALRQPSGESSNTASPTTRPNKATRESSAAGSPRRLPAWTTLVPVVALFLAVVSAALYVLPRSTTPAVSAVADANLGNIPAASNAPVASPVNDVGSTAASLSFKEIHGATEEQVQSWAGSLPRGYLPTWIAPRRNVQPVVFDAVALPYEAQSVDHVIQFIHDDWATNVRKEYDLYQSTNNMLMRAVYGNSTVMVWGDKAKLIDSSYWWGSQDFVNSKAVDGLKYEKQFDGVSKRWLPVSVNVSHRPEMFYEAVFRWQPYLDCMWHWSLTEDEIRERMEFYREKGWRPHRISVHEATAEPLFTLIFVLDEAESGWEFSLSVNQREHEQSLASHRARGMFPRCLASWVEHDEVHFAVIWDATLPPL